MAKVVDAASIPVVTDQSANGDSGKRGDRTSGMFDFANSELIKEKIRNAKKPENAPYNVHDVYHKTGIFQRIAKDPYFENVTLGVIVINAIWISIDTDLNKGDTLLDADPIFVLFDSLFFGYFSMELFIRFMAFQKKCSCLRDAWFVFDSTLVALYFFDPFIITIMAAASGGGGLNLPTSILRLFRLARLSRLVRMLRSLPELMIMIKGMFTAAASVSYTLGLQVLITYVFAIALTQLASGKEGIRESFFKTVPLSMYSLFIYATFLDNLADFCNAVKDESTPCLVLVTLYIVLAALTVMNMLIGVLCEVISATAEEERESMMTDKVHEKFGDIVGRLDTDKNCKLSWAEFQLIMDMPDAIKAMESVNIDPIGMIDFAEDFFFDDGEKIEITFDQFMDMLLDLRGGQQAQLKDVMMLGKRFNKKSADVKYLMEGIEEKLDKAIEAYQKKGG